jgi:hypothetical protein
MREGIEKSVFVRPGNKLFLGKVSRSMTYASVSTKCRPLFTSWLLNQATMDARTIIPYFIAKDIQCVGPNVGLSNYIKDKSSSAK